MEPTAATTFTQRLRRFVRWFFTVSPDALAEPRLPLPPRAGSARVKRQDSPRLRAQNAGRVHVSDRKPS